MDLTENNQQPQPSDSLEIAKVALQEEKLKVARRKQKIGEVVVRKQVEQRMVKIPIRREKLVVERIGKHPELLTETVINEGQVNGFKYGDLNHSDTLHLTYSKYLELATAQQLLEAIAHLDSAPNVRVRLEIVSNCSEDHLEHQDICDRYKSL